MTGICGCVMGPPPGGRCNACGAYGEPLRYAPNPQPLQPGTIVFQPLTEDDVRRIIREELDRAKRV